MLEVGLSTSYRTNWNLKTRRFKLETFTRNSKSQAWCSVVETRNFNSIPKYRLETGNSKFRLETRKFRPNAVVESRNFNSIPKYRLENGNSKFRLETQKVRPNAVVETRNFKSILLSIDLKLQTRSFDLTTRKVKSLVEKWSFNFILEVTTWK